jgi:hypothetical protein
MRPFVQRLQLEVGVGGARRRNHQFGFIVHCAAPSTWPTSRPADWSRREAIPRAAFRGSAPALLQAPRAARAGLARSVRRSSASRSMKSMKSMIPACTNFLFSFPVFTLPLYLKTKFCRKQGLQEKKVMGACWDHRLHRFHRSPGCRRRCNPSSSPSPLPSFLAFSRSFASVSAFSLFSFATASASACFLASSRSAASNA